MSKHTDYKTSRWFVGATPFAGFILFYALYWGIYWLAPGFHETCLRGEDQGVEWLTFVCFFAAFLVLLCSMVFRAKMSKLALLYLGLMALFYFVCAGEEISWGQRVLGFDTPPTLAASNDQGEFNIHNLKFDHFHPKDALWLIRGFGVIAPLLLLPWMRKPNCCLHRYIPPPRLVPCFLFPEIINATDDALGGWLASHQGEETINIVRLQSDELQEMYFGVCVLLGVWRIYQAWRRYEPASVGKSSASDA